MKLREWIDVNENLFYGDLIVRVLKTNSLNNKDRLFDTVISMDRAKTFFGDFEIACFGIDCYPGSENMGLKVVVWADDPRDVTKSR